MAMASKITCLNRFPQIASGGGTGVVREIWALQVAVIPAKARIHSANLRKCAVYGLDSRFRGNDRCFVLDAIPNVPLTGMGGRWQILAPAPNCEGSASNRRKRNSVTRRLAGCGKSFVNP